MNFAPSNPIVESHIKAPYRNATLWLTSLALLIVFGIAIYLASRSSGTSPDELASLLSAFP